MKFKYSVLYCISITVCINRALTTTIHCILSEAFSPSLLNEGVRAVSLSRCTVEG